MPFTIGLRWLLDSVEIDARMLALLAKIAEHGSLKQATGHVGLSYRHAWALLGRLEQEIGQPLVRLERGRGATLTPLGERLAEHVARIEARFQPELKRAVSELDLSLASRNVAHDDAPLRLTASHDLALAKLVEALPAHRGPAVTLHVQGSVDALVSLARNRCDVAGFHVPRLPGGPSVTEPYRRLLTPRSLRLVHFADRSQGLIVARNNPLRIGSIRDLARVRARFVNRQPGSGTRIFFDALMATHGVRPAQITGYRHEEFTHAAVAAMIASGAADAAFGIEAAAAQHGLGFIPIAWERYFLAMREATVAGTPAQGFLKALDSRWFAKIMREMPGYVAPLRAIPMSVNEALGQSADEGLRKRSA
jgi:molybdate transport repressor ModE-like protein